MALHDGIAWHAGSFGARTVSNSTNLFSSEHSSPSQLLTILSTNLIENGASAAAFSFARLPTSARSAGPRG